MCGIAGVIEFDRHRTPSQAGLEAMATVLAHRGPDDGRVHRHGPLGLVHRRLSIIDLETGQQPMHSADDKICLVFNGELYNYRELKSELEQRGRVFRTRSDTEVLLEAYVEWGHEAFSRLNAMFACAFWDARSHELVLARDRFGKKPLYIRQDADRVVFASEIKAILAYNTIDRQVDLRALHEFLTHGYIVSETTIFSGIRRIAPASVMVVGPQQTSCRRYWRLAFDPDPRPRPDAQVDEELTCLLEKAVERRLISDVPLGAFLSGGLDSSGVVAFMGRRTDRPVRTFSIGFEESDYSELADARVVAKHLGTDHHELVVKASAIEVLPRLVWHFDEPFGDSSAVATYYVSRAAREHVTVALSGDGGDEVFAGYTRYRGLERYRRMARIPLAVRRALLGPLVGLLPFTSPGWNFLYAAARVRTGDGGHRLGLYPYLQSRLYTREFGRTVAGWNAFETTDAILRESQSLDPITRFQYLDTLQYLPSDILTKVDRMSMANSLEVRSPLLDYELVEYVATLPLSSKLHNGVSKYAFRSVCARLLPASTLSKAKQGFAIPKDHWFRRELGTLAKEILLDPRTLGRGYVDGRVVKRILDHHAAGHRDYSDWIWCLVVLEMWFRTFIDRPEALRPLEGYGR